MALLTQSNVYKNPQANILYGTPSGKYTPQQIRDYVKAPGRTDDEILGRALADGVSADEIASAMAGVDKNFTTNMNKYLEGKGITRELAPAAPVPAVKAPPSIVPGRITVGAKDTVAGQMHDILQDPNNPLNVQAMTYGNEFANKRGLLNSSIAASAAQDALYKNAQPIASQDASTNYDSNKTNVGNKLTADMFNNDLTSRVGMFNAGTAKDISINDKNRAVDQAINTQNRSMDFAIANMDAGNKLAIAQVQAAANDSGIMGDLGKSYMNLYQQTAADPNISPEVKNQIYNTLKSQFQQISGLLPSFESAGKKISFNSASNAGGTSFGETPAGNGGLLTGGTNTGGLGESPKLKSAIDKVNVLGYKPEPQVMAGVASYERATGSKVDRSLVVPEQLVEDFRSQSQNGFTTSYLSSDGTVKSRNPGAYDFPALIKLAGVEGLGVGGLQKLFIPVHPPGSMRADNPMFYVWNTEVLNRLK